MHHATDLSAALRDADHPRATTAVLQQAVDQASQAGGTVVVPPGTWTICTLFLKSNMTFHLARGAVLAAHDDLADYPALTRGHNKDRTGYHLIVAEDCDRLTISGDGEIDGRGEQFWEPPLRDLKARGVDISNDLARAPSHWPIDGPFWRGWNPRISPTMELRRCTDLILRDFTIRNSPGWTIHPYCCDRVRIDGVTIDNHMFGPNTDGIDVNGCRDVLITNCRITGCDDNIILKATPDARSCERIAVTNCTLKTNCAALGLGAETASGIRDVTMSNCTVEQALRMVQLEMWTGGLIENVAISNLAGRCMAPAEIPQEKLVYIDIQRHARTPEGPLGVIRHVNIAGITAETRGRCVLSAGEDAYIEDVTLRDIDMTCPTWEDQAAAAKINRSGQNSNSNPWVQQTNAVVVAENVKRLWLSNIRAQVPPAGEGVVPVHGLAGRNVRRAVVDCPFLAANTNQIESALLENCTDVDLRAIG